MAEIWQTGDWLVVDAAGPEISIGLLSSGNWRRCTRSTQPALPALTELFAEFIGGSVEAGQILTGFIYGSGPGSTLGLRLAAMILRSWVATQRFQECRILTFQHLEVALMAARYPNGLIHHACAPWRKDCMHLATLTCERELQFTHRACAPEEAAALDAACFQLGIRSAPTNLAPAPFPFLSLPDIFAKYPGLLRLNPDPEPFLCEEPDFARWQPERHRAS